MQYYPDPVRSGRLVDWLQVIRGDFEEAPDLRVTTEEAQTRWPLPVASLGAILDAFVDVRFLYRRPDGVYGRWATDGSDRCLPGEAER